jgi:lysophospholipase
MAKKKLRSAAGAAEGQLKARAKKIRGQLAPVEKAAERFATKAKDRLPSPTAVKAELPDVGRKLKKATASMTKRRRSSRPSTGTDQETAHETPPQTPTQTPTQPDAEDRDRAGASSSQAAPSAGTGPDDSWTVADLRAEAKRRGLTGYSRKTKAELLAQLRR